MRFLEFGKENHRTLVMFHASCMTWDFLEAGIRLLAERYHVIVPVLPGYDMEDDSEYTSVEAIAAETEDWLLSGGYGEIHGLYGISMGGSIAVRLLANGRIRIHKGIIDAGITPYRLPKWLSNLFVWRNTWFILMLKDSMGFFTRLVPEKKYGSDMFAGLRKVMEHSTRRTIKNNFRSCSTYTLPDTIAGQDTEIRYWYGSLERALRGRDARFVKRCFPHAQTEVIKGCNHAEFVMLHPEAFAEKLTGFLES
ncbi:MAG: alpha/beta hydrolase [Clostridia bacterium]|nr:alpha/beta hydrolase [Clostridia bacterium]